MVKIMYSCGIAHQDLQEQTDRMQLHCTISEKQLIATSSE